MGIPSPTGAHYFASLLFTKFCTYSVSIMKLSPKPSQIGENAIWDFGSIAVLTRSLIECYLVFFYLCIEKCASDEWDAKIKLMNLHDYISREKMFNAMGENDLPDKDTIKQNVILELKSNSWFQKLDEKKQKHFLKGNTAFFKSQDEIVESSGGNVSDFRWVYRFLSNNTHSFPMGFYRIANDSRGCGVETKAEMNYTAMCLHWSKEYLKKAILEFTELFENSLQSNV
jgi:hypothetical protein